jgi:tRNA-guanine family transglycosylase
LTPFSYSESREKVSGFNDEEHFLINSKAKVHVREYFKMA